MTSSTKSTRRLFLASGAAAAVFGALHAAAAPPPDDPIFAAIERHREAEEAFAATLNHIDEIWAQQNNYTTTQADRDAYSSAGEAAEQALDELIATVPTTLAGLHAMLAYTEECDDIVYLQNVVPALLESPVFAAKRSETA